MLVVFGPYRRTIPFPALGDKADDDEGGDEDDGESGGKFEEVEEVLHDGSIPKQKATPWGGFLLVHPSGPWAVSLR